MTKQPDIPLQRKYFDLEHVLHDIKHYLPSQTPIKDFIHHNTLHAFQDLKFFDAIFKASEIFGYQATLRLNDFRKLLSTGRINENVLDRLIREQKGHENFHSWKHFLLNKEYDTHIEPRVGRLRTQWKTKYGLDIENEVQPILFRMISAYLDQGIAEQKFPTVNGGLLANVRALEKNGFISFFKNKNTAHYLFDETISITDLLDLIVGDSSYYTQYLYDQQFSHQGWSGLVAAVEQAPYTLLASRSVTLKEFIHLELLLEYDTLLHRLGTNWKPLAQVVHSKPIDLFKAIESNEYYEVLTIWQKAFEWSYYDQVLNGIIAQPAIEKNKISSTKSFQAIFCIDERECSLRRHIEQVDPACETLGSPGFFGVEFYFQPENGQFYEKLCPAPVFPKYVIKEVKVQHHRSHEWIYDKASTKILKGTWTTLVMGTMSVWKTIALVLNPKMTPAISNAFSHMNKNADLQIAHDIVEQKENDLQVGYTVDEMALRVEGLLRGIGLVDNFAPIIYVLAHGSSSANNPHHSAHDCGACSGRPGSSNSRVFAALANRNDVREKLGTKGIFIPANTHFVGGMHDTAADQIEYYDEKLLTHDQLLAHQKNKISFEQALDCNATERSRRFASINTQASLKKVRKSILDRSVSMFEPRPELGHGTNSLCIIGHRDLSKKLFLDRRAFLNSYDYRTDPDGTILTGVMRPIGLVCGGINLEYYFSRIDNYKFGSGTKLPHNVVGLFGVANSSDGDLRPGLPLQMIEVHDPVRLLVLVQHYPEIVHKAIQSSPEIYEWYKNEWVHIMAVHPENHELYYLKDGAFQKYDPISMHLEKLEDVMQLIKSSKKMETNYIVDATKENLPVFHLN